MTSEWIFRRSPAPQPPLHRTFLSSSAHPCLTRQLRLGGGNSFRGDTSLRATCKGAAAEEVRDRPRGHTVWSPLVAHHASCTGRAASRRLPAALSRHPALHSQWGAIPRFSTLRVGFGSAESGAGQTMFAPAVGRRLPRLAPPPCPLPPPLPAPARFRRSCFCRRRSPAAAVRPLSGRCPAALSDQSISRGAFRCHGVRQGSSLACPPTHSPPYPHEPVRARHILALTASLGTRRTGAATPSTAAWSHPALLSTPRGASFAAVRSVPNAAQKNLAAAQQVDLEF